MTEPFDDEAAGRDYDPALMRRFLGYVRPHAGSVALALLLMAARISCELSAPAIFWKAVDGPVASGDVAGLSRYAALFLAAVLGTGLFEFLYSWTTSRIGQDVILDLRMHLFSHLQKLSVSFFDRNPVGRLVVRVTSDVENLNELFTSGLVEFAADLLMLFGVVGMMFYTNATLALVTMSVTPLIVLATVLFRSVARRRYREMRVRIARLNSREREAQFKARDREWLLWSTRGGSPRVR
jgi:ATP-binding cassette, subfamily B, multidrug efflux pump